MAVLYAEGTQTCSNGHPLKGINGRFLESLGLKICRKCEREAQNLAESEATMKAANPKFSHKDESTSKSVVVVSKDDKTDDLLAKQAAYMLDKDGNPKVYALKTWGPDKGKPDPHYSGTAYLIPDIENAEKLLKEAKKRKDYEDRECYRSFVHNPHVFHSYALDHASQCKGSGKAPAYPYTSYSTKAMTKYDTSEWGTVNEDGTPKPMSIERAKKIALDMHKDQKDKLGYAYGGHLIAVYEGVKVLGGSKDEQIAALFHDAVEDFHTTYKHLEEIGVNENTRNIIKAVSKGTGEEQNAYLARIIAQGPQAMRVKLADLIHNTRHDRIEELRNKSTTGESTVNRLLKKYRPAMARLMLELNMLADEERQNLVTKPVGSSTGTYYTGAGNSTAKKSTPSKPKTSSDGKPIEMTPRTLMKGDWLGEDYTAPILGKVKGQDESLGTVDYALCNGEVITLDKNKKYKVWTYSGWSTNIEVVFNGVDSMDYGHYIEMIDGSPTVIG